METFYQCKTAVVTDETWGWQLTWSRMSMPFLGRRPPLKRKTNDLPRIESRGATAG